jgi:NAD(P)H-hydrate epimerase
VQESRIETAIGCAQEYNAIVVLKGSRSIVAFPDGSTHINLTGNSGMATGGSGDVLTGTISGLLAQMKDAPNATLLGVYLHGLAGDFAFETSGNGLIAGDIADNLPRALVELGKPIEPPVNARLRKLE